ncbi:MULTISPECIES: flagellar basal body rod protein FlgB [Allobacillus]|uniref:Flagellar basal body rod protein FlgB n=1 Tax=Allobacillus salarius TaxID=1955272 RepID=A0A556PRZ4_9BACI|nr:flagellar basal body rod protein FlgB [Allobacillus salarius]TSJ67144.1 flagellar basal body rod protein FlgB [Allobacillus salarius]
MKLFNNTFNHLAQGLDYASTKNKVIANNIANVDTPNYKAKKVSFHSQLEQEQSKLETLRTHPKHIPFNRQSSTIKITQNQNHTYNHNGNSVDLDKEMAELSKNQLYYEALTERINGKFNSIRTVLGGGR